MPKANELKKGMIIDLDGIPHIIKQLSAKSPSFPKETLLIVNPSLKFISLEKEWPPNSGRIIPKMYFIDFLDLYKGTNHEGTLLGVIEGDLELVTHID